MLNFTSGNLVASSVTKMNGKKYEAHPIDSLSHSMYHNATSDTQTGLQNKNKMTLSNFCHHFLGVRSHLRTHSCHNFARMID